MLDLDFTFLFALLNLAILYFFVKKFLFSRLGAHMDKRTSDIVQEIEKGNALVAEGEQIRRQQEEALYQAREERQEILEKARAKAQADYEEIIVQAKKESVRILQNAREEAERERQQIEQQARTQIAALAIAAASKVIEQNMDNVHNQELVKHFLDKEAHL